MPYLRYQNVATVLTVYGIETEFQDKNRRQKYLSWLQQYLPFTVLKLNLIRCAANMVRFERCNSTYRLRY